MSKLKQLKEDIKNIAEEMRKKVQARLKPMYEELKEFNPKLADEIASASTMSLVLYFLEEAIEHWVDERDDEE